MKTFCVLGAGTYGSYLCNVLTERFPNDKIVLVEVGNREIKSEEESGFFSSVIKGSYNGAKLGRYFGLGGTSGRWGGQLLFFSKLDFGNNEAMNEITEMNLTYRDTVLKRFFKKIPPVQETPINNNLFIKKGIWLPFNKRNLFDYFKINKKGSVEILTGTRLIKITADEGKVTAVTILKDGKEEQLKADIFYLTCGALESLRILNESGLTDIEQSSHGFSDHISMRCFKIKQSEPIIHNTDFTFRLLNKSLITTRIIGEVDGLSFYAHPIYNEDFIFFQFLKKLIFKRQFSVKQLLLASTQFFHLFPFAFNYLFLNKLYSFKPWYINIDIEMDENNNSITKAVEKDKLGEHGININFSIPQSTINKLFEARVIIRKLLIESKVMFEELNSEASTIKLEDTYHPYKLINWKQGQSFSASYNPLQNLYVFNTGILQRIGGINPTAALFCLIEKHVKEELSN